MQGSFYANRPRSIEIAKNVSYKLFLGFCNNSTEEWLDTIEDKVDYEAWYLGHWHTYKRIDKIHFLFHDIETL